MLCSTHTCVVCLGYAGIARSLYIARLRGKKPAYAGGRAQAYLIYTSLPQAAYASSGLAPRRAGGRWQVAVREGSEALVRALR